MTNPERKFDRSSARPTCLPSSRPFASFCRALLFVAAFAATAQQLPTSKGVNFYSLAKEIEIGRVDADRMVQLTTILHGPDVNEYLSSLGSELAANANELPFSFTFAAFRGAPPWRLLAFPWSAENQGYSEAIAIAGGPVFLPAQLAEKLDNEAELAAVLAHAIAHTALRHATRMATELELVNLSSEGLPGDSRTLRTMAFTHEVRRFEQAADALAVQILAQAGRDPAGLIGYLQKLPAIQSVFRTLPNPEERIQAVKAAIALLPVGTYRAESGRFTEWKSSVAAR